MSALTQTATHGQEQLIGFTVGNQLFGIAILAVQEIIRMVHITPVPNAPEYINGIINLRGKVLPVIDFRARFAVPEAAALDEEKRRIIIVNIGSVAAGIIVDSVSQVLKLTQEQITDAPDMIKGFQTDYIKGVGKMENDIIIMLDFGKVLSAEELGGIAAQQQ